MLREEARLLAKQAAEELKNRPFNSSTEDVGFDLYTFELDEKELNVFAYIGKQRDERGAEWYAVFYGVECIRGDDVYTDYSYTNGLITDELEDEIFALGNMYTREKYLEELRELIKEVN